MGRRAGLSVVLVLGAIALGIAIYVGNSMGNRVLGQIATHGSGVAATPIPQVTTPPPDTPASRALWKRRQVLSVATDPAFPDPRITPEPEIPATPRPPRIEPRPRIRHAPITAVPKPTVASEPEPTPDTTYTSPAVAVPTASHAPEETISPDATQSLAPRAGPTATSRATPRALATAAARTAPTLPPVTVPSVPMQ
ncbi:MAG: hypothetical protein NVS3B17_08390 [Vulcanimicrobiaceae bacterium]